jgi:transposase
MSNCTRYLGLDVHAETITAAIAEGRGQIRNLGKFPNRPDAVRKLIERVGGSRRLKVCYEAGPTGYALYWQLTKLGVDCEVIAPSLIPKKAGDKVKTDRRDAEKLAQSYQAGDLTPVWVPTGVAEIAWKAQERLHRKFTRMTYCRKPAGKVTAAVAREMVGFIWAIGTLVESQQPATK